MRTPKATKNAINDTFFITYTVIYALNTEVFTPYIVVYALNTEVFTPYIVVYALNTQVFVLYIVIYAQYTPVFISNMEIFIAQIELNPEFLKRYHYNRFPFFTLNENSANCNLCLTQNSF
jgi:hypothetical protein